MCRRRRKEGLWARSEDAPEYQLLPASRGPTGRPRICNSADMVIQIGRHLTGAEKRQMRMQEFFGAVALNNKNEILGLRIVAVGAANGCMVNPVDVFRYLLETTACRWAAFHNHPSGDPTPSPDDVALTRRLQEAGKLMGLQLLEHVITGPEMSPDNYTSLRDSGILVG